MAMTDGLFAEHLLWARQSTGCVHVSPPRALTTRQAHSWNGPRDSVTPRSRAGHGERGFELGTLSGKAGIFPLCPCAHTHPRSASASKLSLELAPENHPQPLGPEATPRSPECTGLAAE